MGNRHRSVLNDLHTTRCLRCENIAKRQTSKSKIIKKPQRQIIGWVRITPVDEYAIYIAFLQTRVRNGRNDRLARQLLLRS